MKPPGTGRLAMGCHGARRGLGTGFSHTNSGHFARLAGVGWDRQAHPAVLTIPFTGQGLTS